MTFLSSMGRLSLSFSCFSANEMGRKILPFFFCHLFPTPIENNQGRTSEHLHPFHTAVFILGSSSLGTRRRVLKLNLYVKKNKL